MKILLTRTVIISVLIVMIFTISCTENAEGITYSAWELYNDTDHSIGIIVYENSKELKPINLNNKGSSWQSEKYESSWHGDDMLPIYMVLGGDSLTITFDKSKQESFLVEEVNDFNIYDKHHYNIIQECETLKIYRYTFTEADYKNAEPIGAED